ncbi:carboxymuconolactone decarboxylase family protein [Tranquillimonas alkanivorans]|uniref:Alkylhydroperoxidase AhpD family core domain-containing protein n=1 Tax=Tranquillimonas alkanivorans TaxID=441119 RepID=A0A1I5PB84_9RHOB|nr:carboxymuconolactone decarboxylase family protein [Tranquillimonas alkanivorans]SFP31378.1 alkylhydroperoxidase AhpD family core domain-containing protein [Tranquillimonas alkanivorans]
MKTHLCFLAIACAALSATPAASQDAPNFFAETYPSSSLDQAMQWYGSLSGPDSPLDAKTRELVALGVSAQIPCDYCVYAHASGARNAGATEEEIRAAVATAGAVRNWSTVLNGMSYDLDAFKQEYDSMSAASN